MPTLKLAALCVLTLAVACDTDEGDDTGADTAGSGDTGIATDATMASAGDTNDSSDADDSGGDGSTGGGAVGPVDDPRPHCELPDSLPGLGACGGDVCFEYHGGSPGCVVDQDECPVERMDKVLTGICNRQGENEVFLFYWATDMLSDQEIINLRDTQRAECEELAGVWCDTFL